MDTDRQQIRARFRFATVLALLVLTAGLMPGRGSHEIFAADTLQFQMQHSLEVKGGHGQYDVFQAIVDFAPGAATPVHRVAGPTIITVLAGEMTRIEDGKGIVYKTGQSYIEFPEEHFDIDANKGTVPARLLVTFLLKPGQAQPLLIHPNEPPPAIGPAFTVVNVVPLGVQPADFKMTQGIVSLPAGGVAELLKADGVKAAAAVSGTTAMVTLIVPSGVSAAPAPAIRPPSTGDGGLAD
jgi:quercetin dioxygenase-like cupin family protein